MRTKHLLYTMALASVFAACTQDEFVTEGGSINPLEGRKSLGKITLVEAEGPSTRWTVDNWNTFKAEVGDGFSYLLVDEPRPKLDGQHEYPIDNYELVNHIHTNYVFKYDGERWGNDANLVEGNYLLIGPDQKVQNRKPVEIKLPAKQNLALGKDGKVNPLSILEEFNESGYPILIGHRFLSEGGDANDKLPARYNIFAYPEITVKNSERNDELTPVVTKVILKRNNAENPFIINAPLDNKKAARLLTNESFKAAGEGGKNQFVVGGWEAYMNKTLGMGELTEAQAENNEKDNTQPIPATEDYEVTMLNADGTKAKLETFMYNNGLKGFTKDLLAEKPTSTSQYIVINMPGNGVEVPRGTEFTFNAVIPADQYVMGNAGEDLEIFAVLSTGEVYKKIMKSNSTVEMYPGKRYPDQDYTGMEVKGTVGEYFTIDVNEGGSDGVSSYEKCDPSEIADLGSVNAVKTTEDLIAVIKGTSSTQKLSVTVEGDEVVYNETVNSAVANTDCQIINILGHIKIEGSKDKALTINNKVSFDDAVIEKNTVIFDSETATLGTVFVGKGATLELRNVALTIDTDNNLLNGFETNSTEVHNAGTLKLYSTDFAKVYNYETLEVYTDVTEAKITTEDHACSDNQHIISAAVNLTPSVDVKYQVLADGKFVAGKYKVTESELDYPIVVESKDKDNVAELILGENVTIVKNGKIENNGKISSDNSATLTVQNGLGETLTNGVNGYIESKVIINGASHKLSELSTPVAASEYKKAAQVTNNGVMKDVKIDGLLKMGAGSRLEGALDMTPGYNGEIDNTAMGTIVNDPSEKDIVVFAEIDGMDLTSADAIAATSAEFKAYTATTRVKVARLTGAVVMRNNIANNEIGFRKTEAGLIEELEFAKGSSLTIGEGTFKTNLSVSVSYENIEWTGRTDNVSQFTLNGAQTYKKKFVKTIDSQVKAVEGNVIFTNCEKVTNLE